MGTLVKWDEHKILIYREHSYIEALCSKIIKYRSKNVCVILWRCRDPPKVSRIIWMAFNNNFYRFVRFLLVEIVRGYFYVVVFIDVNKDVNDNFRCDHIM